jgi:hypothetical protein
VPVRVTQFCDGNNTTKRSFICMYVILVGECEVVGQMTKNMFLPKHILLTLQKRCDNVSLLNIVIIMHVSNIISLRNPR